MDFGAAKNLGQVMRSILLLAVFTMLSAGVFAQKFPLEANTPDGKTVVLYEDGTWRPRTLVLDQAIIRKTDFATLKLPSKLGFHEFWVDPKLWKATPPPNASMERFFTHESQEAWCGIIPERIQVTREALAKSSLGYMTRVDANARVEQKTRAFVNGMRGDVQEVNATVEGFFLTYYVFLWSGSSGTVQISCWTSQNLIEEYKPVFNDFFGGFMLLEQ